MSVLWSWQNWLCQSVITSCLLREHDITPLLASSASLLCDLDHHQPHRPLVICVVICVLDLSESTVALKQFMMMQYQKPQDVNQVVKFGRQIVFVRVTQFQMYVSWALAGKVQTENYLANGQNMTL